jgi:threonine dehydrogenase-like Zn-dependent dehydrogenase
MRGAYFTGDKTVELRELPEPRPGPGEVVVAMRASGLCGSDLKPYRTGTSRTGSEATAVVPGHEPCGVVVELGPGVTGVSLDDRVMVHHYAGCRECEMCRAGYTQMCVVQRELYGGTQDGGHEDMMAAPDYACVPLPDELTFAEGAACACGTGTAFHAVKRLDLKQSETVAIFGQGPVGLSATMFAATLGARVLAVDVTAERLRLAEKLGADVTIDTGKADAVKAVKDLTGGRGADATLDATGIPEVRNSMLDAARDWGRACFVGEGGDTTIDVSAQIIHRQLTVYGSWTFSIAGLDEVARFVVDHHLPMHDLITDTFEIDQIQKAYTLFEAGRSGKVVIAWDDD